MADDQLVQVGRGLIARYEGATPMMLEEVLLPLRIPIAEFTRTPERIGGGWALRFRLDVGSEIPHLTRGRTGKVVSTETAAGLATWAEITKARIHEVVPGRTDGELHLGRSSAAELNGRIPLLELGCVLEIDRFGAAAKVESGLTEAAFVAHALAEGYEVTRMPEDIAQHLGAYANFDVRLRRNGLERRVELKSLWGTNPRLARLIKSKTKTHPTSSCRFDAQDIFAVNLWLRTGRIVDFAFARSRPWDDAHPYGLPRSTDYPEHVHQNPSCTVGDGVWFGQISDVWDLE